MVTADIVDADALLKTVVASLVAVVGVTAAFSFAVVGFVRGNESRREERPVAMAAFYVLAAAGLGLAIALVTLGLVIIAGD